MRLRSAIAAALLLDNASGDYPTKSGLITFLSPLIFRSVFSWRTMLFHSICSFRHLLCSLHSHSHISDALPPVGDAVSPSSGYFPFNFFVFLLLRSHHRYQSPDCHLPLPPTRIFTTDCNFGSFVSSSLAAFCFYLSRPLSSLSITGSLSILPPLPPSSSISRAPRSLDAF